MSSPDPIFTPPDRPTQANFALAVTAVGAGMLAMLLTYMGISLPLAVLIGLAAGVAVYFLVRNVTKGGPN